MLDRTRLQRLLALLLISVATVSASGMQEHAANGQIYGELKPFVGLDGVRFQLNGLGGAIWNVAGVKGDPETTITGLSRAEHEQLYQSIRADTAAAFRAAGIPLLENKEDVPETLPNLVVDVSWYRVTTDLFAVQVDVRLMEAARLLKNPARIVWTTSWDHRFRTTASRAAIATTVGSATIGFVNEFIGLYKRAHAKAG